MKPVILTPIVIIRDAFNMIRWPNLLMLGGIQVFIYYCLLEPADSFLSLYNLVLIILITILIGGGGYVINDYYDSVEDSINKPEKWIAGKTWALTTVKYFYLAIVFTGFILSIWLAIRLNLAKYIFIYPLSVTALWIYSYALKCRPVIGNIVVSLFCAGVVGIVAFPDILLNNSSAVKAEIWFFIAFAFLTNWLREVIKDIEDVEGDAKANCRTAVVRFGIKSGKIMSVILGLILIISLLFWDQQQSNHWIKLTLTVLQGFTAGALALVWWAKNRTYYHYASTIMKLVMVAGTLLLIWI